MKRIAFLLLLSSLAYGQGTVPFYTAQAAAPAGTPVTVDATTLNLHDGTGASNTWSFSHTFSGSNRVVFVYTQQDDDGSSTLDSVKVGTLKLTRLDSIHMRAGGICRSELFYGINPSSGSQTVQIWGPHTWVSASVTVVSVQDANQGGGSSTYGSKKSYSPTGDPDVFWRDSITSAANNLVIQFASARPATSWADSLTVSAGQTSLGGRGGKLNYYYTTITSTKSGSAASIPMQVNSSAGDHTDWNSIIVTVKPP